MHRGPFQPRPFCDSVGGKGSQRSDFAPWRRILVAKSLRGSSGPCLQGVKLAKRLLRLLALTPPWWPFALEQTPPSTTAQTLTSFLKQHPAARSLPGVAHRGGAAPLSPVCGGPALLLGKAARCFGRLRKTRPWDRSAGVLALAFAAQHLPSVALGQLRPQRAMTNICPGANPLVPSLF